MKKLVTLDRKHRKVIIRPASAEVQADFIPLRTFALLTDAKNMKQVKRNLKKLYKRGK